MTWLVLDTGMREVVSFSVLKHGRGFGMVGSCPAAEVAISAPSFASGRISSFAVGRCSFIVQRALTHRWILGDGG